MLLGRMRRKFHQDGRKLVYLRIWNFFWHVNGGGKLGMRPRWQSFSDDGFGCFAFRMFRRIGIFARAAYLARGPNMDFLRTSPVWYFSERSGLPIQNQ